MKSTSWAAGLSVFGDGVGGVAVRLLAEQVGLTGELSSALSRRGFVPGHDRGQVLVDVATMLAGGGEAIADIDTVGHQDAVLRSAASPPTVWRALDGLTPARLRRVEKARARTSARVWDLAGGPPAARVAGRFLEDDLVVFDVDATIVLAHSEGERGGDVPTYVRVPPAGACQVVCLRREALCFEWG